MIEDLPVPDVSMIMIQVMLKLRRSLCGEGLSGLCSGVVHDCSANP